MRKMLEVLAAKGYVQLAVNPQDKRNLSVSLSEQTYLFFEQFDDKGSAFVELFFNGISLELLESSRQTFEILFQNMDRMENKHEKIAVVYKSKYGSTKKYAQWIAKELDAELMERDKTKASELQGYESIIYGGGLYAGGVSGISLITKILIASRTNISIYLL